jgi:hypothetical protein
VSIKPPLKNITAIKNNFLSTGFFRLTAQITNYTPIKAGITITAGKYDEIEKYVLPLIGDKEI